MIRGLRRRNGSQWRDAVQRRVRFTEPRVPRREGEQKSGPMLLSKRESDANSK